MQSRVSNIYQSADTENGTVFAKIYIRGTGINEQKRLRLLRHGISGIVVVKESKHVVMLGKQ